MVNKSWTAAEDQILVEYYPVEGSAVYKRLESRSSKACKQRAAKLGIAFNQANLANTRPNRWTEEENQLLRSRFPTEGKECFADLPGRTEAACYKQVEALCLISGQAYYKIFGAWTEDENNILRKYYPIEGNAAFDRLAPHRTAEACKTQVQELGLHSQKERKGTWHTDEDLVLRVLYPLFGSGCFELLLARSTEACRMRVKKLGLNMYSFLKYEDVLAAKELSRCWITPGHNGLATDDAIAKIAYLAEAKETDVRKALSFCGIAAA